MKRFKDHFYKAFFIGIIACYTSCKTNHALTIGNSPFEEDRFFTVNCDFTPSDFHLSVGDKKGNDIQVSIIRGKRILWKSPFYKTQTDFNTSESISTLYEIALNGDVLAIELRSKKDSSSQFHYKPVVIKGNNCL